MSCAGFGGTGTEFTEFLNSAEIINRAIDALRTLLRNNCVEAENNDLFIWDPRVITVVLKLYSKIA
eukprot:15331320-Ditylum_brightwellii.AAC.1